MAKKAIFNKKNVLVIGGAGFIGSHLCDELIKTSKVICIDNFSTGDEKNIDHLLSYPDFEFIKYDITNPIDLSNLSELQKFKIEFQGIQEIYHLACPTSPKNFEQNKIAILLALSSGIKNTLDLTVKYEAKFIYFSSSVIYGYRQTNYTKIKEDYLGQVSTVSPRSCYDEGKRFAETIIATYQQLYKINAKTIRLFRVYGPRMKLNDGQLVSDFINSALNNQDIIIPGDKNFSSSFCYVSDVINATLKLADSLVNEPINIGSDVDINLTNFVQKIIDKVNSKSKIKYGSSDLFITPLCLPNIIKAYEELGWIPIVTLDKGLEKTIDDLQASKGLKSVGNIIF
ncbi:MAG: NAD-dependent epimerase/dehydratase family protein [Patescibacteria group bacterium]|nr:NAD-dependent epimerase/dehydratase family protein [Patescibacteria group bacterium]MBU1871012.1 NAD-dependent epimerase/dehydratase family protein [Patescibacteria group bacterium]